MNFAEFKGLDILNGYQFTNQQLDTIMNTAAQYEKRVKAGEVIHDLEGCAAPSLFFEPSTRTRLSFEAAINRTGAKCISMADAKASSQAKGETLEDTNRTVDGYVDCIVMRHPVKGAAVTAAGIAEHPVINGGDGAGQHPTQALLDIYTIRKEKGHIGGQTITFLGDLKYGRTVHSLGYFMQQLGNKMIFASPDELKMPEEITADLRSKGADIVETDDVQRAAEGGQEGHHHSPPPAPGGRDRHRGGQLRRRGLLPPGPQRHVSPHGPPGPCYRQSAVKSENGAFLRKNAAGSFPDREKKHVSNS